MAPLLVVAEDLADGRLVRLLTDYAAPSLLLHILTLPNTNAMPKLRSFIDTLILELGSGLIYPTRR